MVDSSRKSGLAPLSIGAQFIEAGIMRDKKRRRRERKRERMSEREQKDKADEGEEKEEKENETKRVEIS